MKSFVAANVCVSFSLLTVTPRREEGRKTRREEQRKEGKERGHESGGKDGIKRTEGAKTGGVEEGHRERCRE